jgi:hypothetical protein
MKYFFLLISILIGCNVEEPSIALCPQPLNTACSRDPLDCPCFEALALDVCGGTVQMPATCRSNVRLGCQQLDPLEGCYVTSYSCNDESAHPNCQPFGGSDGVQFWCCLPQNFPPVCVPKTCQPNQCGNIDDGCTHLKDCGPCS